jgi:CRP-like cAMP-binding protein
MSMDRERAAARAMIEKRTLLEFLSSLPLFKGISPAGLAGLVDRFRLKRFRKGASLFLQYDPPEAVYLLWKGAVAIQLENLDGRGLVINQMNPGDCFGELSVLTGQPHSASAEVMTDSEILVIPCLDFMAALEKEPALAMNLLVVTARRLQASSRREEALAFYDAQQRLADLLLSLDVQSAEKGYIHLSQEELAHRIGLTRQTTAEILGRWRRKGWLLTGRGNIVLLNRAGLQQLNRIPEKEEEF